MTEPTLREALTEAIREGIHNSIHDRCGEAWIETEVVVDAVLAICQPGTALRYGDLNCDHEWSGPLDKHPTCVKCSMAYPPALNLLGECRERGPHPHAFIGPHRFNESVGADVLDEIEDLATHPDGRSPKEVLAAISRKARATRVVALNVRRQG